MSQIIINGKGALHKIEEVLRELGSKKVLLVCDGAFPYLPVKDFFDNMSVPVVKFNEFTVNPLYEDVCKGVDLFNREGCDVIIAVGGGSSIDVAKCIKLFAKMDPSENYLKQEFKENGIKLIALPTTAGTGSESTRYAVIYYKGEKQSVADLSIIPDYAVLESSVLLTLPEYQKKCTFLDALCQAIESWWSVNSTEESHEYSKIAIKGLLDNLDDYLNNSSESVLEAVMTAANFAGRAINVTQTTAAHAMSYKLTSLYHLPHGHSVAICLPGVWRYMINNIEKCIDPRGSAYLAGVFEDIAKALGAESPVAAVEKFAGIIKGLGIDAPVIPEKDIEVLGASVNPVRLKNNPVALTEEVLKQMYRELV